MVRTKGKSDNLEGNPSGSNDLQQENSQEYLRTKDAKLFCCHSFTLLLRPAVPQSSIGCYHFLHSRGGRLDLLLNHVGRCAQDSGAHEKTESSNPPTYSTGEMLSQIVVGAQNHPICSQLLVWMWLVQSPGEEFYASLSGFHCFQYGISAH